MYSNLWFAVRFRNAGIGIRALPVLYGCCSLSLFDAVVFRSAKAASLGKVEVLRYIPGHLLVFTASHRYSTA